MFKVNIKNTRTTSLTFLSFNRHEVDLTHFSPLLHFNIETNHLLRRFPYEIQHWAEMIWYV